MSGNTIVASKDCRQQNVSKIQLHPKLISRASTGLAFHPAFSSRDNFYLGVSPTKRLHTAGTLFLR